MVLYDTRVKFAYNQPNKLLYIMTFLLRIWQFAH